MKSIFQLGLKIFDHIFTGSNYDKLSREFNVTLATQSSLDKLYWLGQVRIILLVHILTDFLQHRVGA